MSDDNREICNLEAERATLGAMLIDNERIGDVSSILRPEDFFRDSHQAVYAVALRLWGEGMSVDTVTVPEAMGRDYRRFGGDDLLESITAVPHAANAVYHAGIVREKSLVRGLLVIAEEVSRKAEAMDLPAGQLLDHAQGRIMDLMTTGVRPRAKGPSDLADEMRARLIARSSGLPVGLRTGITDLDKAIGYLEPGNMIVLGARPSMGKTTMILNICEFLSINCQLPTLFLSLEMLTGELMDRVVANIGDVDYAAIQEGRLSPQEYESCCDAADAIGSSRMYIDDGRGMTLTQVCSTARMYRARHGVELVAIDYIGKIKETQAKNESRWEVVKRVSNRLKDLSGELKIPILVAAQINRQSGSDRPTMSQLRESGDIEADADIVALLHKPSHYDPNDKPGQVEVLVDKARKGPTGIANLQFDGPRQRISNLAPPRFQEAVF